MNDYEEDNNKNRRKSNQTTFSWSSTSSYETDMTEDEEDMYSYTILLSELNQLNKETKEIEIGGILCRAASHGDIQTIQHVLVNKQLEPYINVDIMDEEGSTPLIYASCFGQLHIVKYLLHMGANVDCQDKIGWTALMWATTNNYHEIVQILLEHSASSDTQSTSGRTMYDLVDVENEKIMTMIPLTHALQRRKSCRQRTSVELHRDAFGEKETCEASFHKFVWDQCLPDQMFVFAEQDLEHVLDIAISQIQLPMKTRAEIYVPVNIIFLSARYAHYYTSRELLHQLLTKTIQRIDHIVKSSSDDIHTLAFWIANLSQLVYYLKKDTGLVIATAEHQLALSELISETYTLLVLDSEKRLDRILEPAMLECEQIDIESIEFADDWHRFFFRRNRPRRSSMVVSPHSITSLLTSILVVLQSYDVHAVIAIQAMAHLCHFMSCELFHRVLANKKYLCRSRALQVRMNLTVVEEWIREHHLPTPLASYFNPVVQLVQLLQCVSQLTELLDFTSTVSSFDLVSPVQMKQLVLNYRYEVSEPRLPESIEKYIVQLAEEDPSCLLSKKSGDKMEAASQYRLPLSLPSSRDPTGWPLIEEIDTHDMSFSDKMYHELKHKMVLEREKKKREKNMIPSIPEAWLNQLDHH